MPKENVVIFSPHAPIGGFYANSIQKARQTWERDKLHDEWGRVTILSGHGNQVFIQGPMQNLNLKKAEADDVLRWVGADPETIQTINVRDAAGKSLAKPVDDVLLAPSDRQAENKRKREGRQPGAQENQPQPQDAGGTEDTENFQQPENSQVDYTPNRNGVFFRKIRKGGSLDDAGVRDGDVVERVNYTDIGSPKQFKAIVASMVLGMPYILHVNRQGKIHTFRIFPDEAKGVLRDIDDNY